MLSQSFSGSNLIADGIGILLGCLSDAIQGLLFHGHDSIGGRLVENENASSWAYFLLGVAFLNLAFVATVMVANYRIAGLVASCVHLEHHLYPSVPSHNAARGARLLKEMHRRDRPGVTYFEFLSERLEAQ